MNEPTASGRAVFLSVAELLYIYQQVMQPAGEFRMDLGLLESAVLRPRAAFDDTEFYPAVLDKAAALLHSLINNHPFVDGNKPVGYIALEAFLRRNRLLLSASEDEKYELVMAVARAEMDQAAIRDWLAGHIAPSPPARNIPSL